MKKILIIAASIIGFASAANAQNASGTAQQTVQLALSNALEITFTGNSSATGATVSLPFTTVNDYANGVESTVQQLKVRSNKMFNVTVKSSSANFTGSNGAANNMPVAGVLKMKVTANTTGGNISGVYQNYGDILTSNTDMIINGNAGGNQLFSVQYKAVPGFAYPAGTYTTNVVYTATQP